MGKERWCVHAGRALGGGELRALLFTTANRQAACAPCTRVFLASAGMRKSYTAELLNSVGENLSAGINYSFKL